MWLSDSTKSSVIYLAVSIQSTSVTDGQTDGQNVRSIIAFACSASCGENLAHLTDSRFIQVSWTSD